MLVAPDPYEPSWEFEKDALLSIKCALRFFALDRGYPVMVFHTLDAQQLVAFRKGLPQRALRLGQIRLVKISFSFPDGIDEKYLADGRCTLCGKD